MFATGKTVGLVEWIINACLLFPLCIQYSKAALFQEFQTAKIREDEWIEGHSTDFSYVIWDHLTFC